MERAADEIEHEVSQMTEHGDEENLTTGGHRTMDKLQVFECTREGVRITLSDHGYMTCTESCITVA